MEGLTEIMDEKLSQLILAACLYAINASVKDSKSALEVIDATLSHIESLSDDALKIIDCDLRLMRDPRHSFETIEAIDSFEFAVKEELSKRGILNDLY